MAAPRRGVRLAFWFWVVGAASREEVALDNDIAEYYRLRAREYDAVYRKPERQVDIVRLGAQLATLVEGRRVLEVAAGTGYWTAAIAPTAKSVLATDAVDETLAVARSREYPDARVEFAVCDAFALDKVPGSFDAALACFWLSHLTRDRMPLFFRHLGARLEPGARVVVADNMYVEGSNHPITRTDAEGNTFQRRALESGAEFEVVKNFPTPDELCDLALAVGVAPNVVVFDYYWLLYFETAR
jgi:SAM-dependent methyltransferase